MPYCQKCLERGVGGSDVLLKGCMEGCGGPGRYCRGDTWCARDSLCVPCSRALRQCQFCRGGGLTDEDLAYFPPGEPLIQSHLWTPVLILDTNETERRARCRCQDGCAREFPWSEHIGSVPRACEYWGLATYSNAQHADIPDRTLHLGYRHDPDGPSVSCEGLIEHVYQQGERRPVQEGWKYPENC